MSSFALKLTALISMFIDHSTFVLYIEGHMGLDLYYILRGIGRLAFPIYCFMLVNGFQKTHDRVRYLMRLMGFAVISQIPFTLCLCVNNHYGVQFGSLQFAYSGLLIIALCALVLVLLYFAAGSRRPGDYIITALFFLLPGLRLCSGTVTLLDGHMNVFYTLALGLALICFMDSGRRRALPGMQSIAAFAALAGALLLIETDADYSLTGIMLILMLYFFRESRIFTAAGLCLWACVQYGFNGANLLFTLCAAAALLPILLYNGRKGPSAKYFFYCFYPVHLAVLGLVSFII